MAKVLIDRGADIRAVGKHGADGGDPLWLAAMAVKDGKPGGLELAKLLVEKGADLDAVGKYGGDEGTPLWWAAWAVKAGRGEEGLELAKVLVDKAGRVLVQLTLGGRSR